MGVILDHKLKTPGHLLAFEPLFVVSSLTVNDSDDDDDDTECRPHHRGDDNVHDAGGQTALWVTAPSPLTVSTIYKTQHESARINAIIMLKLAKSHMESKSIGKITMQEIRYFFLTLTIHVFKRLH